MVQDAKKYMKGTQTYIATARAAQRVSDSAGDGASALSAAVSGEAADACVALAVAAGGVVPASAATSSPDVQQAKATLCVEVDGVQAVLRALKAHPREAKVQQAGMNALFNLAEGAGGPAVFVSCDGAAVLVAGLEAHPDAAKVQQWGCFAVQVLAMDPAAAAAMVKAGAVAAVTAALRKHSQPGGSCYIALCACSALHWLLKQGGAPAKAAAQKARALDLAKTALATYSDAKDAKGAGLALDPEKSKVEELQQRVGWLKTALG